MRAALLLFFMLIAACGRKEPEQPKADPAPIGFDRVSTDRIRHGERLATVLGCRGCHGDDMTGDVWSEDRQEALIWTSNLRRAVPEYDDAALERAIRAGVRHDGSPLWEMPSEIFTELSSADIAALIAYLRAQPPTGEAHPRPTFGPAGRREIAAGEWRSAPEKVRRGRGNGPPQVGGSHDRARYMIRATCSECHGLDLRGQRDAEDPRGPPDLDIVGAYDRNQFRRLMRTGLPPGDRDLGLMRRVSVGRFAQMTISEVDAIYDYLHARAQRQQ